MFSILSRKSYRDGNSSFRTMKQSTRRAGGALLGFRKDSIELGYKLARKTVDSKVTE